MNNMYKQKEIKEISCDVKHCVFNGGYNKCFAGSIKVENPKATQSEQTLCSTFLAKDEKNAYKDNLF